MKSTNLHADTSGMLLTGTIFLANLDHSGYGEYAIKTITAGLIWIGFTIAKEIIINKIKNKKEGGTK